MRAMNQPSTTWPTIGSRGLTLANAKSHSATVRRAATLLDAAFRIPGTRIRFGWDPIVGLLLPVVGDVATVPIKLAPVGIAWKLGGSRWLLAKMLLNIGIDSTLGAIPIVGDIFDFFFKSNLRNARLLATLTDSESGR